MEVPSQVIKKHNFITSVIRKLRAKGGKILEDGSHIFMLVEILEPKSVMRVRVRDLTRSTLDATKLVLRPVAAWFLKPS